MVGTNSNRSITEYVSRNVVSLFGRFPILRQSISDTQPTPPRHAKRCPLDQISNTFQNTESFSIRDNITNSGLQRPLLSSSRKSHKRPSIIERSTLQISARDESRSWVINTRAIDKTTCEN